MASSAHISQRLFSTASKSSSAKTLRINSNFIVRSSLTTVAPHNHILLQPTATTSTSTITSVSPPSYTLRQFHSTSAKMSDTPAEIVHIQTQEQFNQVLKAAGDKLVVIDFFATWCGPCKVIAPQFKKMSLEFENVAFYKLDVDENQQVAAAVGVRAMPTFVFYKDGKRLPDEVVGANLKALKDTIEKNK